MNPENQEDLVGMNGRESKSVTSAILGGIITGPT